MSTPRIAKAVTKGVVYAGAFYAISETEIPEKISENVKTFNKEHLIQPSKLKPTPPAERKALESHYATQLNQQRHQHLLRGTPEQNTWSKPLVWYPGAKRNGEEDSSEKGGENEWKVVGSDGQVVGVEKDITKTVVEVSKEDGKKRKDGDGVGMVKKGDGRERP